jgi:hypothetical protein
LSSSPVVTTRGAPALGLTHTQSMPAGTGWVPLVSIAIVALARGSAAISGASSWSSGSPPVHTTYGPARPRRPTPRAPRSASVGGREAPTARAVGADEVGVAPRRAAARAATAILGAPRPQVAAGEPHEHRRATGVRALALQA